MSKHFVVYKTTVKSTSNTVPTIPTTSPINNITTIPSCSSKYPKPKLSPTSFSQPNNNSKKLYVQALKLNVDDIIHIKDTFPSLLSKKIVQVNNILNTSKSVKPQIKIIIKGPSKKQIIVPMSKTNTITIICNANTSISNINKSL